MTLRFPRFRKRPVAPYLVPVPGLDDVPSTDRTVLAVEQPELVGQRAPQITQAAEAPREPVAPPSPRLVSLLALDSPTVPDLSGYLADSDPQVRVAAISVLTENTPDGFAPILVRALRDPAPAVRRTAAEGLRELVEVLPTSTGLADHLDSPDPLVRATVVDLLRTLKSGTTAQFTAALSDSDHRVRIEAVRALVSLDDRHGVAAAAADHSREVRVVVAQGLSVIGNGGHEVVRRLTADRDPLVRAAALTAFGALGAETAADIADLTSALRDSAWQVRVGAARGLTGADPESSVPVLADALDDPHLDVRKAAVLALATWPDHGAAQDALRRATADRDADVRAYARRAATQPVAH